MVDFINEVQEVLNKDAYLVDGDFKILTLNLLEIIDEDKIKKIKDLVVEGNEEAIRVYKSILEISLSSIPYFELNDLTLDDMMKIAKKSSDKYLVNFDYSNTDDVDDLPEGVIIKGVFYPREFFTGGDEMKDFLDRLERGDRLKDFLSFLDEDY